MSGTGIGRLLTEEQLAETLQVPAKTLRQWRYKGCGPAFCKVNKSLVRYREQDVEAWIEQSRVVA